MNKLPDFIYTKTDKALTLKMIYPKIYKTRYGNYAIHRLTSHKDEDSFREVLKAIGKEELFDVYKKYMEAMIQKSFSLNGNIEIPVPDHLKLKSYQKAAIEYIELCNGKCLLGEIMGSGKGVCALAYLNLHPELRPVLIVCPLSVIYHWEKHIDEWIIEKKKVHIVNKDIDDADFYIINWDKLNSRKQLLHQIDFQCIIGDEAHKIKNPKAKRTKAFIELAKDRKSILLLTGTPLHNKPVDLFPLINLLNRYDFPRWIDYIKYYCDAKQKKIGKKKFWVADGKSNTKELFERLRSTILRRAKPEELLKQLPDYQRILVPLRGNQALYDFNEKIIAEANQLKTIKVAFIGMIEKFFNEAIKLKMNDCLNFLENILEEEDKVVVFVHHRDVMDKVIHFLKEKKIEYSYIIGGMPKDKRQSEIDKFQKGPARAFVGSIEACGEGISLTSARTALFFELRWNLETLRQAEMRLLRIGQKRNCLYYYFVVDGTIEANIVKTLEKKAEAINQILEGKYDKEINLFDIIKGGAV